MTDHFEKFNRFYVGKCFLKIKFFSFFPFFYFYLNVETNLRRKWNFFPVFEKSGKLHTHICIRNHFLYIFLFLLCYSLHRAAPFPCPPQKKEKKEKVLFKMTFIFICYLGNRRKIEFENFVTRNVQKKIGRFLRCQLSVILLVPRLLEAVIRPVLLPIFTLGGTCISFFRFS